ncbi:metallophosphoesterase [Anaerovorax odorimutans]|uniref:Metallophosphoesterase n=1 Tax=Anaerovorax odorimutans TaxID=109327 RepID=A0ABT1RRE7_9FIRM|nr:metallophosphoesterase [Anaerovorax odorimutans]MCQ4637752.1 metallophosphoesterase [Anaerovorax odorimutans]
MSIYAIGDLHLSFAPGVEKPMDIYGSVWTDHARKLKNNWLELIRPEDTIILAGDISWGLKLSEAIPDLEWIDGLPGKKVIFKGNHDLWWSGIGKLNSLYDSIRFVQNTSYEAEGYFLCGSRGWICPGNDDFTGQDEKIYKRELLRLDMSLEDARSKGAKDNIIGVLHYPPSAGPSAGSGFTEAFAQAGVRQVVYGHLHGQDAFKNGLQGTYNGVAYRLVSLDYLNCRPVLIKE